ncbi:cytochrome c oxidase subunit 2 [Novosphingobium sp. PhB57]|uniref:cytochrome c oxidase subunit II n=2 Tax=unclassified Novosphingobium TaxID=2644732 RepID=UPI00104DF349|nr:MULTISPECIES: cytochrome c oxidase subunit II [unclassified Novosphingobium]TCU55790.1 cytochrome c oxidase subunit 2 [Novosphingobium sp. PhB57]TDW64916.1 cytochrome c oxidase subunit 2 [Novosphingobium sp. PhB55]
MILGKTVRTLGEAARALGLYSVAAMAFSSTLAVSSAIAAPAASAVVPAPVASYTPLKPTPGIGMPVEGGIGLQQQFSKLGEYGEWIHDGVLMPIITVITLFVLLLIVIIAVRYNRRANPVASKTSHNTILEVVWTLVPVLVLIGIAVPSIDLIAKQYKPAPKGALTIKVTGNQWFWTYGYPDNGDFEVVSNMLNLPGQPIINNGVREVGSKPWDGPSHLEVDNRMVVPVGEPIRLQITAADVIHSFAVPSLWFKLDAVPGRINEKVLLVEKPGVYYGQCSELCGAKHGYMPIAVEALPRAQYDAWVLTHAGGVIDGQAKPAAAAAAAAPAMSPGAVATAEATEASASEATAAAE